MKSFLSLCLSTAMAVGISGAVAAAPLPASFADAAAVASPAAKIELVAQNGPPEWKVQRGGNGGGNARAAPRGGRPDAPAARGGGRAGPDARGAVRGAPPRDARSGARGAPVRGAPVARGAAPGRNAVAAERRVAPVGRGGNPPRYAGGNNNANRHDNDRRYVNNRYVNNRYYYNRYAGPGWYGGFWSGAGWGYGTGWGYRAGYRAAPYYGYGNYGYYNRPNTVVVATPPLTTRVVIKPWSPAWYNYCGQKYRSFNSATGYYTAYSGRQIFCTP